MKIMFDECMPPKASRLAAGLLALSKPPIKAHFLADYLGPGLYDSDWTKRLADETNWCVVTCDYRNPTGSKAKAKGPPLHLILPSRQITGFFLGGKIAQASGFEKIRAVLYLLPDIWEKATLGPNGGRFKILKSGHGYKIAPWPPTVLLPSFPIASPPPSSLFPPAASP
jgi:hypothetical protein